MKFCANLQSALIGLCLSAIAVSASRGLSLSVSSPENVDGIKNLKVVASLQNTGDETLKILKDPRGVLSTLPTEAFGITDIQGVTPSFNGVKLKFVPEHAAKLEESIVVLEPGKSIEVEHDLSSAYNFTLPGEGLYDIHADNFFQIIDPATNELTELRANQETSSQVNIKGELVIDLPDLDVGLDLDLGLGHPDSEAAGTHLEKVEKKATYKHCSATQKSQIADAATAAAKYASSASSYVHSLSSGTDRYTTWFGTYTAARKKKVAKNFKAIKGYAFSGETYDFGKYGIINICGAFWGAPLTGTDSQAGTLVHEVSHFKRIAGTDDIVYGQSDAKSLASSKPKQAIKNADSYEFFAENDPALS
ncbi:hypothetical protein VNI00_018921 [Paramarasmius palmivorus]|uniref:Lysine-specific metallo-endopeptidase domain-containing protein n=1 Tax=Paramarasmius palmivorus TaxID=297713 RepID=A0AAW0ASN8_9AGAR